MLATPIKKWKVTYQDTPFAYSGGARCLIIEAAFAEDAYVTAYGELCRRGHSMYSPGQIELKDLSHEGIFAMGVPRTGKGLTAIISVEEYATCKY